PGEPRVPSEQPAHIPAQFRRRAQRDTRRHQHTDRRHQVGVPAGQENGADDRQNEHREENRVLHGPDVLPDVPDAHHTDEVERRQCPPPRWRGRALTALDLIGVVCIGYIWQHVGAVQNPIFLAVFVLPVIGSIFLSRWHPYLVATVSVLVAAGVALSAAPELRWYVSGLFGGDAWLAWVFGPQASGYAASFSGFYAPSSYLVVLLEVFAIVMLACAVAAEYLGT